MKKTAIVIAAALALGAGTAGAQASTRPSYSIKKSAIIKKVTVKRVPLATARAAHRLVGLTTSPSLLSIETGTVAPTTTPTPVPTPTPGPTPSPVVNPTPAVPDANAVMIAKLFELVEKMLADKSSGGNIVTTVNPVITVAPTTIAPVTTTNQAVAPVITPAAPTPAPVVTINNGPVTFPAPIIHVEHIETDEHHG